MEPINERTPRKEPVQRISYEALEAVEGGMVNPSMTQQPTVATTVTIPKNLADDYLDPYIGIQKHFH